MDEVRKKINAIITTLEKQTEKKSVQDVMDILLNRPKVKTHEPDSCGYTCANSLFDMEELKKWKDNNNQTYMIGTDYPIESNKRYIGWLFVFVKRVIRKMIRFVIWPIVTAQNKFNASVTASINALYNNEVVTLEYLQREHEDTKKICELENKLSQLGTEFQELKRKNSELEQALVEHETKKEASLYDYIDYGKFEDYFRGSQEEILERQKNYLNYFEGMHDVVDLGCGRGEFLELLKEHSIDAVGVEVYDEFVKVCQEKGLQVVKEDALTYICGLEDASVDGIFAAQLVEHLKPEELVQLCQKSYKKLTENGCLIFETPNPTCLSIYTNAFYIDPTHTKPVHPKTLECYLLNAGFSKVEILFTEGSKVNYKLPLLEIPNMPNLEEVNDAINLLSELIFGSQDYAIIAYK